jgi:uncharacterized membrane protein YkoI
MRLLVRLALPLVLSIAPSALRAQAPAYTLKEEKPGLRARATLPADSAVARALRKVPGGVIREAELEEEKGRLVYSFDIRESGKSGIREIVIDAKTGEIVSDEHENEAEERAEQKAEQTQTPKPRP